MSDINAIRIISLTFGEPGNVSAEEMELASKYIEKYPYFVPARYVSASFKNKTQTISPDALTDLYPYMGNWLQLYGFLKGRGFVKAVPSEQTATVPENEDDAAPVHYPDAAYLTDEDSNNYATFSNELTNDLDEEQVHSAHENQDSASKLDEPGRPDVEQIEVLYQLSEVIFEAPEEGSDGAVSPAEGKGYDATIDDSELAVIYDTDNADVDFQSTNEPTTVLVPENSGNIWPADPAGGINELVHELPTFIPPSGEDYFFQQGIKITGDIPADYQDLVAPYKEYVAGEARKEKSLMVMMSFTEWLLHFKGKAEKSQSEIQEQKAIKALWQREKLAKALEEEDDEIPQQVFEMAVNSITDEEDIVSESLAEVYTMQKKYDKALDMYLKLSLRSPEKNAYFALKIEEILKEKEV